MTSIPIPTPTPTPTPSTPTTIPHVVEDCFGLLKLYSDGSIFRSDDINFKNQIHDGNSVQWKDHLFDQNLNLYLRIYKTINTYSDTNNKLPILFYFHGGGFCFGSRTYPNFHNSCLSLCSGLQALVVAPDHRLAPEDRLPAAVDDAHNALKWLRDQILSESGCDTWLCEGVDLDRVFVLGDSSGGNIAHHLAVRLGQGSPELNPVRVRGYVLLAPFFGGIVRTKSEVDTPCEAFWNLEMYDRFWRLALPKGATEDHPLANPLGPTSPSLENVGLDPILVLVGGGEILRDRVQDYVKMLNKLGKKADYVEFEGKEHGFFTDNSFSDEANSVIQLITTFISQNSGRSIRIN